MESRMDSSLTIGQLRCQNGANLLGFCQIFVPILCSSCAPNLSCAMCMSARRVQISLPPPKSACFDQKRLRKGFCSCPKVCMSCLLGEFHPRICLFWREKILKSKYSSAPDRVPCPVYYRQLPGLLADKLWILIWGCQNTLKHWNSVKSNSPVVVWLSLVPFRYIAVEPRMVESDWS